MTKHERLIFEILKMVHVMAFLHGSQGVENFSLHQVSSYLQSSHHSDGKSLKDSQLLKCLEGSTKNFLGRGCYAKVEILRPLNTCFFCLSFTDSADIRPTRTRPSIHAWNLTHKESRAARVKLSAKICSDKKMKNFLHARLPLKSEHLQTLETVEDPVLYTVVTLDPNGLLDLIHDSNGSDFIDHCGLLWMVWQTKMHLTTTLYFTYCC